MSYIYFISAPIREGAAIKVGLSRSPEARLPYFQSHSPVLLSLIHYMPGSESLLLRLRERFSSEHLHGSWYTCEGEVVSFLEAATRDGATDVLSPQEAATFLSVGIDKIDTLAAAGELTVMYSPGGHRRFLVEELREKHTGNWFPS